MDARIKPQVRGISGKIKFAVITKNGVVSRHDTKSQAKTWAKENGYKLRYSGSAV